MTRASATRSVSYQGNGSTTDFTIPFDYFSTVAYVNVILIDETDPDDPTYTQQSYTTHYTIASTTLTMLTAPGSTKRLFIELVVPFTQLFDLIDGGTLVLSTLETYLDKYVTMSQKLKDDVSRCLKHRLGSDENEPFLPIPSEGATLAWSDDGTLVNGATLDEISSAADNASAAASSAASSAASASSASSSAGAAASSATAAASSATAAASSASAAAASAVLAAATAGYMVENSHASPSSIAGSGTIAFTATSQRIKKYVQGSGGAQTAGDIQAGTSDGQELLLIGCSNTNTLTIDSATHIICKGTCVLGDNDNILFNWDNGQTKWVEQSRSA